jgi:hypothetical protein
MFVGPIADNNDVGTTENRHTATPRRNWCLEGLAGLEKIEDTSYRHENC